MIRFTLLVLSFITTLTAADTVWADGHKRPLAADLRRPTMPVSDLEASVKFFTDELGMEEGGRQVYNSPILRAAMRIPDGVDITVLRLNDRNQIGAMVLVSAPSLIINSDANTANATTLALSTHDINAVYARAVTGGYQVIMSPEEAAAAENYPP